MHCLKLCKIHIENRLEGKTKHKIIFKNKCIFQNMHIECAYSYRKAGVENSDLELIFYGMDPWGSQKVRHY